MNITRNKISTDGEGLIFLISQPRSGSTLLQHIIASHGDVHTLPEPWLMLQPIYARREGGLCGAYNFEYGRLALEGYIKSIENGEEIFEQAVRLYTTHLYNSSLINNKHKYFLDKTPRYYHIINDISNIFPKSKIIILIRNPIAVFASILNYNFNNDWAKLINAPDRYDDLVLAPTNITKYVLNKEKPIVVHYEDLVSKPHYTIKKLCGDLNIEFDSNMMEYSSVKLGDSSFVDTKSIGKHSSAVGDYVNSWQKTLKTPGAIALAKAYLATLSPDVLRVYGVNLDEIESELKKLNPRYASSAKFSKRMMRWERAGPIARIGAQLESISERQGTARAAWWFISRLIQRFR